MEKKGRLISIVLAVALVLVCAGSFWAEQKSLGRRDKSMDGWEEYTVYWFDVFDTVTRVVGYAPSQEEWTRQMSALHEDLLTYHRLYDIYHSHEGVTSLKDVNDHAAQGPVTVDPRTIDMLQLAKDMHDTTGGKLDIAMGDLLGVWHDYRTQGMEHPELAQLPPQELLEEAGTHRDIRDLILDAEASTVYFADPELRLDVGSVGKGYAIEQVALAAEERGAKSLFISVGGDLRAVGHRPDGKPWVGGIQSPWDLEQTLCAVAIRDGESLVTSGDYQRFYTVDGKNYCHLIDPDTLYPAEYFDGVSVIADNNGMADCLSTGLFCMSLEEGRALVDSLDGVDACWQLTDGSIVYSEGFRERLLK